MQTPRSQSSETMTKIRLKTGSLKSLDKKEIHSSPNTSGSLVERIVVTPSVQDILTEREETPVTTMKQGLERSILSGREVHKSTAPPEGVVHKSTAPSSLRLKLECPKDEELFHNIAIKEKLDGRLDEASFVVKEEIPDLEEEVPILDKTCLVPVKKEQEDLDHLPIDIKVEIPNATDFEAQSSEKRKFKCNLCDYTSRQKWNLKAHKESQHDGVRYYCNLCDHSASTLRYLQTHKESRHEGKKYPCDECDYAATQPGNLKLHKRSKHDGITYPCDQCDYLAVCVANLKRHKHTKHMGIRYQCDQCEFNGATHATLKRHIESIHEGIRYLCDQCNYSASQQGDLKLHKQSKHENITYPCDLCNNVATTPQGLKRHKESKHYGITYPCDQCEHVATQAGSLTRHKKRKHSNQVDAILILKS